MIRAKYRHTHLSSGDLLRDEVILTMMSMMIMMMMMMHGKHRHTHLSSGDLLTSVSFIYVCVAGNGEMLVFFLPFFPAIA